MSQPENRFLHRQDVAMSVAVRLPDDEATYQVQARNISPLGMMAEGRLRVMRGDYLEVWMGTAGWVTGTVAWVLDSRFGIAFLTAINLPFFGDAAIDAEEDILGADALTAATRASIVHRH